jgi:Tol biopolymer transport system component
LTSGTLSRDGRALAFTTTDATEDLIVMKADGTGLVRLTNDAFRDRAPDWSWDSSTVYFASDRSGAYEIWRIQHDGSGLEQLTRRAGPAIYTIPRISPDNHHLLVATVAKGGVPTAGLIDLTLPFEQRKVRPAAPPGLPAGTYPMGWLSDGRLVIYTTADPKTTAIVLIRPGDDVPRRLPIPGLTPELLVGDRFVACSDGQGLPYLVDLATGATRRVSTGDLGPNDAVVAVTADARTAYFLRTDTVTNLWMLGK